MLERIKEWLNADELVHKKEDGKKRFLLVAFLLPVVAMLILVIAKKVTPFGSNSLLTGDMEVQYYPFLVYYRRAVLEGKGFFYSWQLGLGTNFYPVFAYYLASPLNLLILLCPERWIVGFITFFVILKIGLCSVSFSYYLSKHFDKKDYSVSLFGLLYAMSGYMSAYYYIIMWTDVLILAPLVLLALERMLTEKKGIRYTLLLALSILSNYYLSMHLCIFLCMYFLMQLILLEEKGLKKKLADLGRFAGYSLLAAGIAGVILIPIATFIRTTNYAPKSLPLDFRFYFNPFLMLTRHLADVVTAFRTHEPNIYCGVIVILLLPLYWCNRNIHWKQKIVYTLALVIMLFCFSVSTLNYICHGLNYPNCLPCRQSFLYIFLILCMCYEALIQAEQRKRNYVIAACFVVCLFVAAYLWGRDEMLSVKSIIVSASFLLGEILILFFYQKSTKDKSFWAVLGTMILVAELVFNMSHTGFGVSDYTKLAGTQNSYRRLVQIAKENDSSVMFRIETDNPKQYNEGLLYNCETSSVFSSTISSLVPPFYTVLGAMSNEQTLYVNKEGTPFTNLFLGIHYILSENHIESPYLKKIAQDGIVSLYECTYRMPFGMALEKEIVDESEKASGTGAFVMNHMVRCLGAEEDFLEEINAATNSAGVSYYEVVEDGYYYMHVGSAYVTEYSLFIEYPDGTAEEYSTDTAYRNMLHNLKFLPKGTYLTVTSTKKNYDTARMNLGVFRCKEEALKKACETLNENPLYITEFRNNLIEGNISVNLDSYLILPVIAEEGWEVFVDGKRAVLETYGGYMKIAIAPGNHEIRMRYRVKNFIPGVIVSAISIALLIILFWFTKKSTNNNKIAIKEITDKQ